MKKVLTLLFSVFLISNAFSQSNGWIEFFGGKYRALLWNAPKAYVRSTCCTSTATVVSGDTTYLLIGHEKGDQFQITVYIKNKIVMQEQFYMDGELVEHGAGCGNWFEDMSLKEFVKNVFGYDPDRSHLCKNRRPKQKIPQTAFAPSRGFFIE